MCGRSRRRGYHASVKIGPRVRWIWKQSMLQVRISLQRYKGVGVKSVSNGLQVFRRLECNRGVAGQTGANKKKLVKMACTFPANGSVYTYTANIKSRPQKKAYYWSAMADRKQEKCLEFLT